MRFGSLFTGIGGIDLGLERAGMECAWQVEIEPYCLRVLEKHWPEVRRYGDVKAIKWEEVEPVDLICGGFPCQPFSVAGKRRGAADERNLWPEMLRAVRGVRPRWILGENVPGIGDYIDTICADLEAEAYEILPIEIPAATFGAPHLRYRLFIMAHNDGPRLSNDSRMSRQTERDRRKILGADTYGIGGAWTSEDPIQAGRDAVGYVPRPWPPEPGVGRVVHGIPDGLDRLRALGNAVVPQIAEWLGRRILDAEEALRSIGTTCD